MIKCIIRCLIVLWLGVLVGVLLVGCARPAAQPRAGLAPDPVTGKLIQMRDPAFRGWYDAANLNTRKACP